jgi:predicted nucleic acid-binding protein
MILVDTSVWISHFSDTEPVLSQLLEQDQAAIHPFVVGELVCGNLPRRAHTISDLRLLDSVRVATEKEVHHLMEAHRLWDLGLSWIDVHILASAIAEGLRI